MCVRRVCTCVQVCGREGDYEKCLELIKKILSLSPQDKDALKFKVTCLIHLSKFTEALLLCEEFPGECEFERAYCLYRLDRLKESQTVLDTLSPTLLCVRELKAQALYKQELFSEAAALLGEICESVSDDFSGDREANRLAALVGSECEIQSLSGNTMEQWFNIACFWISTERWTDAIHALDMCEQLGRASLLEEGCSEDEIAEELTVVTIQRAYTLQCLGRLQEALNIYNSVLKSKPVDVTHSIVVANNIIALRQDKDVFDSKKKLKVLVAEGDSKRLTKQQKMSILYNRVLFALGTNQLETCRNLIGELESLFPGNSRVSLCKTALLTREKHAESAVGILKENCSDLKVTLTLAQVHLNQGRPSQALSTLKAWPHLPR